MSFREMGELLTRQEGFLRGMGEGNRDVVVGGLVSEVHRKLMGLVSAFFEERRFDFEAVSLQHQRTMLDDDDGD